MVNSKKYQDFEECTAICRQGRLPPYEETNFIPMKCPHCQRAFVEIRPEHLSSTKASKCLQHLRVCEAFKAKGGEVPPVKGTPPESKKRKQSHNTERTDHTNLITIYKLIYKPENRAVYTGRTKNLLEDRFKQHASRTSGCRLVRNAIRRYGMSKFAIEPIVRCHPDDADTNESYYIMANKTLHPDGYNLRHGSKAGDDSAGETPIVPLTPKNDSCEDAHDDLRAHSDAMSDLALLCDIVEGNLDEDAESMSLALLCEVHSKRNSDLTALCE